MGRRVRQAQPLAIFAAWRETVWGSLAKPPSREAARTRGRRPGRATATRGVLPYLRVSACICGFPIRPMEPPIDADERGSVPSAVVRGDFCPISPSLTLPTAFLKSPLQERERTLTAETGWLAPLPPATIRFMKQDAWQYRPQMGGLEVIDRNVTVHKKRKIHHKAPRSRREDCCSRVALSRLFKSDVSPCAPSLRGRIPFAP